MKFLRPDLRFLDALAGSRLPWYVSRCFLGSEAWLLLGGVANCLNDSIFVWFSGLFSSSLVFFLLRLLFFRFLSLALPLVEPVLVTLGNVDCVRNDSGCIFGSRKV